MREEGQDQPSVAELVRKVIDDCPSIMDCVKMDIVNYTSLANLIKDQVASQMKGRKVNIEAVKMGIVRYAEEVRKFQALLETEVKGVLARSVLELKNDVALLTIGQQPMIGKFGDMMAKVREGRFLQLTQGTETFTLTVDGKLLDSVLETIDIKNVINKIEDQSALTLISPAEIITTPGVVSYITDMLFRSGVNITQIISCHTDTILVVRREDALKAYEIIERKIISLKRR